MLPYPLSYSDACPNSFCQQVFNHYLKESVLLRSATGTVTMIKILVVDDHAVVRAGVQHFLSTVPDMEIGGEAATAQEAIRMVRTQEWDIVLLDIAMPDKSGVEVLKQIKRDRPNLPVLILSMHPENRYAVQILRSGASGYVQKEALATELVEAIKTILRGHKYISHNVAELLTMSPDTDDDKPLHETLSAREYEIFYKLSQGDGVTKIAEELCLSVKTVSTYRARVLQKMNMTSNADIIYYAIKQNLID
jgi:two-component system invasion response regulator UvrY